MKNKVILMSLLAASVMFSGCATLLGGGGSQTININSNKPAKGSLSYTDGEGVQYFTAPATLNVDRRNKDILIKSDDDKFHATTVKSNINPWFWGNIVLGGLIGSTTDSISGAAWKYQETVTISAE